MLAGEPHKRRKSKKEKEPKPGLKLSLRGWLVVCALAFLPVNWLVQVIRKPSELAGLVLPTSGKTPRETWAAYGDLFEDHATRIMTPELLAALAQVESAGNPVARTYWRMRWTLDPFRIFAPASSAVGLYQITDGTLGRCRDVCVRGGEVRRSGAWHDVRACWFNGFYNRLIPSHAVEMTSACLHRQAEQLVAEGGLKSPPLALLQDVAAVSHLCGPRSPVVDALKRGRGIPAKLRCGDHDPKSYLSDVRSFSASFSRLRHGR